MEKLHRESIRLSQVQDIAGCRVIVAGLRAQDDTTRSLVNHFQEVTVVDRREQPSHGYRAVHVVARVDGKPIEIQVRTPFQHSWAELSEKLADVYDPAIKYGGGDESVRTFLALLTQVVSKAEKAEQMLTELQRNATPKLPETDIEEAKAMLAEVHSELRSTFNDAMTLRPDNGEGDAVSN